MTDPRDETSNGYPLDDDFFVNVRPPAPPREDHIPITDEDVEYFRKKIFAALHIPEEMQVQQPDPKNDTSPGLKPLLQVAARFNRGEGVRIGLHENDPNTYVCEAGGGRPYTGRDMQGLEPEQIEARMGKEKEGIRGFGNTVEEAVLNCLEMVMNQKAPK